jgi:hypothetical protein
MPYIRDVCCHWFIQLYRDGAVSAQHQRRKAQYQALTPTATRNASVFPPEAAANLPV